MMWGRLTQWVSFLGASDEVGPIFFQPNIYFPIDLPKETENSWCDQFLIDRLPGELIFRPEKGGALITSYVTVNREIKHFTSSRLTIQGNSIYRDATEILELSRVCQLLHHENADFGLNIRYKPIPEVEVKRMLREQASQYTVDQVQINISEKIRRFYERVGELKIFFLPDQFYPQVLNSENKCAWIKEYLERQDAGVCLISSSDDGFLTLNFVDSVNSAINERKIIHLQSDLLRIVGTQVVCGDQVIHRLDEAIEIIKSEYPNFNNDRIYTLLGESDAEDIRLMIGMKNFKAYPLFLSEGVMNGYFEKLKSAILELELSGQCPLSGASIDEPRLAYDGFSYEKSSAKIWFLEKSRSPMTDQELPYRGIRQNWMLKDILSFFRELLPLVQEVFSIYASKYNSMLIASRECHGLISRLNALTLDSPHVSAASSSERLSELTGMIERMEGMGLCAIAYMRIKNPATYISGHTFENSEITEWLKLRSSCPVTNEILELKRGDHRVLWDNHTLKPALRLLDELERLLPNLLELAHSLDHLESRQSTISSLSFPFAALFIKQSHLMPIFSASLFRSRIAGNPFVLQRQLLLTYPCSQLASSRLQETDNFDSVDEDKIPDSTDPSFSVESSSCSNNYKL